MATNTDKRRPLSEETKAKIGAANRGQKRSPEQRAAMRVSHAQAGNRPETVERHREARRLWWASLTDEKRASLSEARSRGQKARWARMRPEERAAKIVAFTAAGAKATKELWAKLSQEERLAKLADAHRGAKSYQITDEQRAQISRAHKGKAVSVETRKKLSAAHSGTIRSESARAALRAGWSRLGSDGRKLRSRPGLDALKRQWASLGPEERALRTEPGRRAAQLSNPSSLEVTVARLLDALQIEYTAQYPIGKFIVDFYIPSRQIVLECDGEYWHSLPSAIEKDRRRDAWMIRNGYTVCRLPEREIASGECIVSLRRLVS
ncbi:MAG: DUF559 domain-containing protein [Vicinamibacterales bacterium]